ncbi:2OG-Fe dioxygenase-domain-containing protein [Aspergillus bertholletiae]|uniref:2OG-Fe dioxygenase-domain-containing protein n=1 Tax=Aspergillus bertholletiae TaxID=1226010 RepID=A0A5N7APE8_9EURO|nr:2OG-Fe dioxygenase-domain-containing protein [Aspergillus bertholletiae]
MAALQINTQACSAIAELLEGFIKNRLVFVKGERMIVTLKALGATDEDLEAMRSVSNSLQDDPILPIRKSTSGRFYFDFEKSTLRRLEFQPYTVSVEDDSVRHDPGQIRRFLEVSFQHRPKLNYETENFVCSLFDVRTVTNRSLVGDPALEGVHSDGVDFTMTTYLGSENMTSDSAETFVHDNREENGVCWNQALTEYSLGSHQHRDCLDTLLIVDHEKKHSVSTLHAVNPDYPATRDKLCLSS